MTKILLPMFLLLCVHINITNSSHIEKNYLTLDQALSLADQLYDLLQRQNFLKKQLIEESKKLQEKNVLTGADTIGRALATGIAIIPALALYYSKKYIKPEYHSTINNISFALGGIPVASSTWKLTKKTALSLYDFFMYEKEQNSVKNNIVKMEKERTDIQHTMNVIKNRIRPSGIFYQAENPIIIEFLRYYDNDKKIDATKVKNFIVQYPQLLSIDELLFLFQYKKIAAIVALCEPKKESSWFSSEPSTAIVQAILFGPAIIMFSLLEAVLSEKTPEIPQEIQELKIVNDIIKKLTVIIKEQ